ncbi:MAG: peptide/nickel transport system permease protein [Gallionellaceae bacterium]|nr:MAG: peptide/nickel transport system permease protein [Gallionellaceae bacterium]
MNFIPVILWTDALIFLLVAVGIASAWWIRWRPHLLLPWQRVAKSGVGMVSLLVLSLFLLVGLLDTLHYRAALPEKSNGETVYSPEVLSAFDALVSGLRNRTEKTYSAPLSAFLYAKESIEMPGGKTLRDYPRLKYGGAHLADPERELAGDVVKRAGLGALCGLLIAVVLAAVVGWIERSVSTRKVDGGYAALYPPYTLAFAGMARTARALLITVLLLAALVGAVASLAGAYHVLGTDKVGQDVLYLSLKSIRTGLVIGTVTTLVMLPFALLLGVAAGYFRGWVDDVIQYLYTVLSSIPSVLLIAAAVLMMQVVIEMHAGWFETAAARADVRLLCLCLILGVTSWTGLCRLLRGETLKLREMEYIQAAQAFGVSSLRIITRHIAPNVMHIVLISVVMDFSALVLAEAVLSYVGVGVDPTTISFGTMINAARLEMGRDPIVWWALAAAFSFMLVLVLAANLFADAVRDAFDPRLKGAG